MLSGRSSEARSRASTVPRSDVRSGISTTFDFAALRGWDTPAYATSSLRFVLPPSGADTTSLRAEPIDPLHRIRPHSTFAKGANDRAHTVEIGSVQFAAVALADLIAIVRDGITAGRGGRVCTANLDHLRQVASDREKRALAEEADFVVADGLPIVWASRIARAPLPGRVAGSDLVPLLCEALERDGPSVFLIGGDPGTANDAASLLAARHPGLGPVGSHFPPFGFYSQPGHLGEAKAAVLAAQPDLVFVGLPFPLADRFIRLLQPELSTTWFFGVGISFSFLTGDVRRAPRLVQHLGLEWLHRLVQEPQRLVKRYLQHGLPFAARLMLEAMLVRMCGAQDASSSQVMH